MSVARVWWSVIVGVCALGVLLLALDGYSGYSIVVGAVGAAAAVNLL